MPNFFDNRFHVLSGKELTYLLHEANETSNPRYYGYVSHLGSWVIIRQNTSTGQTRYAVGKQNFSSAWTDKENQDYDYFNLVI